MNGRDTDLALRRLRRWLLLFFFALAVPAGALVWQAHRQLRWEVFHQYRALAEELAARVDERVAELVAKEEARAFTDYAFLVVAGDPAANFVQRSPLSAYPPPREIPGLIGWFQVDADGLFTTPLLPPEGIDAAAWGVSAGELPEREARAAEIHRVLAGNALVRTEPPVAQRAPVLKRLESKSSGARAGEAGAAAAGSGPPAQAAFDELSALSELRQETATRDDTSRKVEALRLREEFAARSMQRAAPAGADPAAAPAQRMARKEQNVLPAPLPSDAEDAGFAGSALAKPELRILAFESDVDPLEFGLLGSGHFVLFRKVWREGERYVQGLLMEREPFLGELVENALRESVLWPHVDVVTAHHGNVLARYGAGAARGAGEFLLYRTRLSAPLGDLELIFTLPELPPAPGGSVVTWTAVILAIVLAGGFLMMYRLGAGQVRLARQQQDFVSAVSHELKTPLTSIRMYGEMLREGWAPEEKKKEYYAFIHDESERLTRLINNVLQLARMTRGNGTADLRPVAVGTLLDGIRSKVTPRIAQAGFTLNLSGDPGVHDRRIMADQDHFAQILINLVDNALKFSAKAERREIDLGCRLDGDRAVFTVRDYGPGIPKEDLKRIFRLFYRAGNALTRETAGAGIGLALVDQLARGMGAAVDVVNCDPGAEFRIAFPCLPETP